MYGLRLRIARFALGLSQAKMAPLVHKGLKTIKQYENGDYQPPASVVEIVDEELNIMAKKLMPFMELLSGQTPPTLWLYSSAEELHQHQPEFSDWSLDTYNAYLGHAIAILTINRVSYRVTSKEYEKKRKKRKPWTDLSPKKIESGDHKESAS